MCGDWQGSSVQQAGSRPAARGAPSLAQLGCCIAERRGEGKDDRRAGLAGGAASGNARQEGLRT